MSRRKVFIWLAAASGYTGIGMLLGYSFSDKTSNTAMWLGLLLILLAAIVLGMYISARAEKPQETSSTALPSTSAHKSTD